MAYELINARKSFGDSAPKLAKDYRQGAVQRRVDGRGAFLKYKNATSTMVESLTLLEAKSIELRSKW